MFKFLRGISKSKVLKIGLAVLLTAVIAVSGVSVNDKLSPQSDSSFQVGVGQKVITIGTVVYAAGTVDYTTDGVADDVQFQAAVDALPAAGGKISVLTGNYVFSATVTRAIANVTIEGNGLSTNFTYDGVNPLFTAGGNNWVFVSLVTDAGGINLGATTGWEERNVQLGATYYAYRNPAGSSVFNNTTVASLTDSGLTNGRVPIAGVGGLLGDSSNLTWANPSLFVGGANVTRGATYVVAASNAPAHVRAQADYVVDGVADNVEIQAAIDSMPAVGGTLDMSGGGNFTISAQILINKPIIWNLGMSVVRLADNANVTMVQVSGVNDVKVVGGEFDGNRANQAAISYGFNVNTSNRFIITGSYIHDINSTGISVHGSQGVWILYNTLENIGFNDGGAMFTVSDGISVDAAGGVSNDIHILGNRISSVLDEGIGIGYGLSEVQVEGNDIYSTGKAISMNVHAGEAALNRLSIRNNSASGNGMSYGITLYAADASVGNTRYIDVVGNKIFNTSIAAIRVQGKIVSVTIDRNWLYEQTVRGIYVFADGASVPVVYSLNGNILDRTGAPASPAIEIAAYVLRVQDNYISWTGQDALFINPPAVLQRAIITGNYIYKTNAGSGIHTVNTTYSIISNNFLNGTYTGGASWGIFEAASGDNNQISGNDLATIVSATTRLNASGTNGRVWRNNGYVTENSGSAIILNGNQAVVVAHGLSTTPTGYSLVSTVNETGLLYVTSANTTSFTINSANNVTGNRTVYWRGIAGAGN